MNRFRRARVAELVREVISDIIRYKIKDPRVEGVTISEVVMAADLKSARVYFAGLADGKSETHKQGLEAAVGFIRRELRLQIDLKYIPALEFHYDTAFDNFAHIDGILKKLGTPRDDDI
jgi:ribosome-binding factor A